MCGGEKTLADVPDEDYFDACELTDLMGVKAIEMLTKAKGGKKPPPPPEPPTRRRRRGARRQCHAGRHHRLGTTTPCAPRRRAPSTSCAVVQFKVPGAKNGGSDKGPDGNRIDSIPIANGVIAAGGACDLILYDSRSDGQENTDKFEAVAAKYDALIVRINPGQLSQGTPEGSQAMFDDLMNEYIAEGKLVWSSPKIQTQMGAKDALVKIGELNCGLADTLAYYSEEELDRGLQEDVRLPAARDQAEPRLGGRGHLALLAVGQGEGLEDRDLPVEVASARSRSATTTTSS